jgi:hypothetical protein
MLQPLPLNCDNDGEKSGFVENEEHYPTLRSGGPYRTDRNKAFQCLFESAGYPVDEKMEGDYNESAIRSDLRLHQW